MKKVKFLLPVIAMVFAMASAIGGEMFSTITQGYPENHEGNCAGIQDLVAEATPCTDDLPSGTQCRLDVSGFPPAFLQDNDGKCVRPIYRQ